MRDVESLTLLLPADLVDRVRGAVNSGDFATASDVVGAALREWMAGRVSRSERFGALKADIDAGIADLDAGRVQAFDVARIVERGEKRSADRSSSV